MTIEHLTKIGIALYGTQWQSDLARALDIESRRIRQWLKEERPLPNWLENELNSLLAEKITLCQALLIKQPSNP